MDVGGFWHDADDLWEDEPAQRPLAALETLRELRLTLDRVERLLVHRARLSIATWEEIGGALGVSRQAAHRRHALSTKRAGTVPARGVDSRTMS